MNIDPLKLPPVPVNLVQVPPLLSPPIKANKSIAMVPLLQIAVLPSVPAVNNGFTVIVAMLVSFGHGLLPNTTYWNVVVVAPAAGVYIDPLKVPPVPVNLVQVPPVLSPPIKANKSIAVVELLQIVVLPSVPAVNNGFTVIVAILVSLGQGLVPNTTYLNVDVVTPAAGVKVEPLNVPPVPVNLVQVPPALSPPIKANKSMAVVELLQIAVLPSVPAVKNGVTVVVAILVSLGQGLVPNTTYLNVDVVTPAAGVKVEPLNVPPVPVNLVQVPPALSPPIKANKSIDVVELLQIVVLPSVPAVNNGFTVIVAILVSLGHGLLPSTTYLNVEVVTPAAGVKVDPLNVPPAPVNRVQVPPVLSPPINANKSIAVVELLQIVVLPSVPAVNNGLTVIVAMLVSLGHGLMPNTTYLNVDVVTPAAGVNVDPLNVPPLPVNLDQTPPVLSPTTKEKRSIDVVELLQIVVLPSVPAVNSGLAVIVAMLVSLGHGLVPNTTYWNVDVVTPAAGVNVDPLKVPPVPVIRVQVPPALSPPINVNKSIAVVELLQIVVLPLVPAVTGGTEVKLTLPVAVHPLLSVTVTVYVPVLVLPATKVGLATDASPPDQTYVYGPVPPPALDVIVIVVPSHAVANDMVGATVTKGFTLIVAILVSLGHGDVPKTT